MKTIFLTAFEGIEIRTVFRTPILETLKGTRIIAFTKVREPVEHSKLMQYYREEFPGIEWEGVRIRLNRIDKFFQKLKFLLLKTESTDLHRRIKLKNDKDYFSYFFFSFLNTILAKPIIRKLIRFADYYLIKDNTYAYYFDAYDPDLVISALPFEEIEINLLHEAKRRGIKSIGFISSWDKVTSKCILRVLPDKLICFNDFVKRNLIKHNEVKERDIFVAGIPHYDHYFEKDFISKEVFFREQGIDPQKKLIVYAPMGKQYSNSDWEVIDMLYDLTNGFNANLLVRFQPVETIDEQELKKRPWLIYQHPGKRFSASRTDWDMDYQDLKLLKNTLYHMDLLICYASSLSIDAMVFNKPVININFELEPIELLEKPATWYYQLAHYKDALVSGGIKLADSKFQLEAGIERYLNNPLYNEENRKKLAEEQCKYLDGKAGEKVGNFILDILSRLRITLFFQSYENLRRYGVQRRVKRNTAKKHSKCRGETSFCLGFRSG